MPTLYLAGPLFTEAEQQWLRALKGRLQDAIPGLTVVWPGELFDAQELADMGHGAKSHIFEVCRSHLEASNLVVALLDGTQVDDGTAWEIGYAYAKGIPVYGIRTDFRNAGDTAHSLVNAMIEASCQAIYPSVQALIDGLKTAL